MLQETLLLSQQHAVLDQSYVVPESALVSPGLVPRLDGPDLLHDGSELVQVSLELVPQHYGLELLHDVSELAQVFLDFLLFASFLLQVNCVTDCDVSLAP